MLDIPIEVKETVGKKGLEEFLTWVGTEILTYTS